MTQEPQRSLDGYGPQEMAIPEYRLLQKTGGDWAKSLGGEPGQFFNTITDELAIELNIIVVDILMGRAKWGSEIQNVGPECASLDARTNTSIFGDPCSDCPHRVDTPWSVDATERRTKCSLNYTILGIDLDHDYLPVMIRAHGISALPARQLITQLKMNRALKGEYYRAMVNIKSVAKDTKYGTAFAIHPKIVNLVTDPSKAEELKMESSRLLGAPIPLPEGRPDEEREPLEFTPDGTPFYSEEEKQRLMPAEVIKELTPSSKPPEAKVEQLVPPTPEPEASKKKVEGKKEVTSEKPLDLEF